VVDNGWVLGEDSGLVVVALDGTYGISPFPGLLSNRWLTPERRDSLLGQTYPNRMPLDRVTEMGVTNSDLCQGILALMDGQPNRAAQYCCGLVLWHAASQRLIEVFETTPLQVLDGEPRGQNGFGYDPIMLPMEPSGVLSNRTMAEWTVAEKNLISHRGKAFQKALHDLQKMIATI
jgi:XTP/dITP diphosphohydrolase